MEAVIYGTAFSHEWPTRGIKKYLMILRAEFGDKIFNIYYSHSDYMIHKYALILCFTPAQPCNSSPDILLTQPIAGGKNLIRTETGTGEIIIALS